MARPHIALSKKQQLNWQLLLFVFGISCAILAASVALHPKWRESARKQLKVPFLKVLSTVAGDLLGDGKKVHVVKVRTDQGLFIEVYSESDSGARPLIDKIQLPDGMDGYFHFRGQATNLALDDIDGDQVLEILAPSFDDQLMARLNVYAFNQSSQRFEPISR